MQINWHDTWGPRLAAFVLVAASVGYWGLHWSAVAAGGPAPTMAVAGIEEAPTTLDVNALARLLGGSATLVASDAGLGQGSSRWQLIGVVAGTSGRGAALVAEDDKPAKAYQVGSRVADGLVLQSVAPRRAVLAASVHGPAVLTLELKAAAPNDADATGLIVSAPAGRAR